MVIKTEDIVQVISSQAWKVADSSFNWLLDLAAKTIIYKCHKNTDGKRIAELLGPHAHKNDTYVIGVIWGGGKSEGAQNPSLFFSNIASVLYHFKFELNRYLSIFKHTNNTISRVYPN